MNQTPFRLLLLLVLVSAGCNNNTPAAPAKEVTATAEAATNKGATKTNVFFGNSLTAGYGLEPAQAYPALIQKKLDSLNLP